MHDILYCFILAMYLTVNINIKKRGFVMKSVLKDVLTYTIINTLVVGLWIFLEFLIEGKIEGNHLDSIIALLFSWSLYANYKHYRKRRK